MRINIVNYEQGRFDGILSKYARKMEEGLKKLGHKVAISRTPSGKADVTHHINYESYVPTEKTINTLMVTHINTDAKMTNLQVGMKTADMGICFSEDTQKYLERGGFSKLTTVLPAHDSIPKRPRIVSILTNVYPNGCKREEMLNELLKHIDKTKFVFFIMGKDWEKHLESWMATDFQAQYFKEFMPEDYKKILDLSDYCLYFGKDEGSMGILDAKNAGVKCIAPDGGFHADMGIEYPFDTQEELNKIFDNLSENPVEDWTWDNYVKQHETIWGDLLKKKSTKK
jgi:hypothetical protein